VLSVSAHAQGNSDNDNALIGRAHSAPGIAQCLAEANSSPLYEITAQVETTGICFAGGFLQTVTFYRTPVCHQEPCPKPATEPVAQVVFGCEGEIVSATCLQ
jgi:hypothetical protein